MADARIAVARDTFPPISDYAVIGDCRSAALISRHGAVDWLCWPNFGSDALFAAILDLGKGGTFCVSAPGARRTTRSYIDGSNVLQTTFETDTGVLQLTDSMTLGSNPDSMLEPQRELLRAVECLEGRVEVAVEFTPRPGFGRRLPHLRQRGPRAVVVSSAREVFCLHTSFDINVDDSDASGGAGLVMTAGERHHLSLSYTAGDVAVLALLGVDADRRISDTTRWWHDWCRICNKELASSPAVVRSVLVLKMLSYALSGATVAAPTASLPEHVGGIRNWDYRFCWLRDAGLTLRAFMGLGYQYEARAFLDWMLHATRRTHPQLQVLYDIYGNPPFPERELSHLRGYRDSQPVRIGNAAQDQLQLDIYGEVCLSAREYVERGGALELVDKHFLAEFGQVIVDSWQTPDHGIWEVRGKPADHTYSKLMCWVALDSLLALDDRCGLPIRRDVVRKTRADIRHWIENEAWSPAVGAFVFRPGTDWPDASLLAMSRCGFLPADDPRLVGTYEIMQQKLGAGALMYRYPPGSDGLPGREGTFGIAGFWAVDYLARLERFDEAEERFNELCGYANDVGLFSEEIDAATGAHLGNFPQAFTHIGLINAAITLQRKEQGRAA